MPILEGNYTATELETIAAHALVRDGFSPDLSGFLREPENTDAGLIKRNRSNDKVFIYQIYQSKIKNRRIALFSAVTDINSPTTISFQQNNINESENLSTLEAILKNYHDSKLAADELIIPIMICNNRHHDKHWAFLHIKKDENGCKAVLYDPSSTRSPVSTGGIKYIEDQIKLTFHCHLIFKKLGQQPAPNKTISILNQSEISGGAHTAENIINIVQEKNFHLPSVDEMVLRQKHNDLHNTRLIKAQPQSGKSSSWSNNDELSSSASPASAGSSSDSDSATASRKETPLSLEGLLLQCDGVLLGVYSNLWHIMANQHKIPIKRLMLLPNRHVMRSLLQNYWMLINKYSLLRRLVAKLLITLQHKRQIFSLMTMNLLLFQVIYQ